MKQQSAKTDFLASGGAMGKLIASKDWSGHPLGPIDSWPQSLLSALSICLHSKFPMCVYWGSDFYLLYNDAWSDIPGDKHPDSLGKTAQAVWTDIWDIIEPSMTQVLTTGQGTLFTDALLPMYRHGFVEEAYFDYTFSPIMGEDGKPVGILNVGDEVTRRILSERRTDTLRQLSIKSVIAESPEAAAILAANTLSENHSDAPFSLTYLLSNDGSSLRLVASSSIDSSSPAAVPKVSLADHHELPLKDVLRSKKPVLIDQLDELYDLPGGPWDEPANQAVIWPLIRPQTQEVYGVFIGGVSPRLTYDALYVRYYRLVTESIAISIGNAYDLRRKLNLEAREQEAQDRLNTALSTGSIGIWNWDIRQNKVIADQNLATRFGVDINQAQAGLPLSVFTDSIHPDDRPWVLERITAAVEKTKSFEAEYRTINHDGAIRWVIARGKIEDDENGKPIRFPGVMVDVTDRKEVERELASSERMFSALFESSILGVAVATLDGRVHEVNQTFLKMFGYTQKEFDKGFFSHMITPSQSKEVTSKIYQQLREKGELETTEKEYIRKDGVVIPVIVGGVMIPGTGDRFICFMLDISEQKQLRALNKAKDEFISIASHQLRTPATGVKQYLGMLLEGYAGNLNEDQTKMLTTAYQSNERQLVIVDDLLKVAEADADEVLLEKAKTNVTSLLQDIIDEQSKRFEVAGQELFFVRDKKAAYSIIDPLNMRMAFENIIDNAHKYTLPGKSVTVSVSCVRDSVRVSIKDEGIGIYKKDLSKLFKKFSRIDNPLSTSAGGTGLGLYWVHKIIDLHEGTIDVFSKYKQGTEFVITLKAAITKT